jgi:hypothetical protein
LVNGPKREPAKEGSHELATKKEVLPKGQNLAQTLVFFLAIILPEKPVTNLDMTCNKLPIYKSFGENLFIIFQVLLFFFEDNNIEFILSFIIFLFTI